MRAGQWYVLREGCSSTVKVFYVRRELEEDVDDAYYKSGDFLVDAYGADSTRDRRYIFSLRGWLEMFRLVTREEALANLL